MREEWRDIAGFEGMYQVSNLGRVKSVDRYVMGKYGLCAKKSVILRPMIGLGGYNSVHLRKKCTKKVMYIHRLVAMAFLPVSEKPMVNHINGNKFDNRANNLEWCTKSENMIHALATGLSKKENGKFVCVKG